MCMCFYLKLKLITLAVNHITLSAVLFIWIQASFFFISKLLFLKQHPTHPNLTHPSIHFFYHCIWAVISSQNIVVRCVVVDVFSCSFSSHSCQHLMFELIDSYFGWPKPIQIHRMEWDEMSWASMEWLRVYAMPFHSIFSPDTLIS